MPSGHQLVAGSGGGFVTFVHECTVPRCLPAPCETATPARRSRMAQHSCGRRRWGSGVLGPGQTGCILYRKLVDPRRGWAQASAATPGSNQDEQGTLQTENAGWSLRREVLGASPGEPSPARARGSRPGFCLPDGLGRALAAPPGTGQDLARCSAACESRTWAGPGCREGRSRGTGLKPGVDLAFGRGQNSSEGL